MELSYLNNYENFKSIVDSIITKSHLQKKRILKFHKTRDDSYFIKAEEFAKNFKLYLKHENIDFKYATDAYLKLCSNMIINQLRYL